MNRWVEKLKMRLPAITLLMATLLFWGFYYRYLPDGPVLLKKPSLSEGIWVRGDCTETNGHFVLRVPEGGEEARINFRMAGANQYQRIRVRGRIKTDDVVEGWSGWRCARLLLVHYTEQDRWIPRHHGVASIKGTSEWEVYEDIFEIMPDAAHVDVSIQQLGARGSAEFDEIEAQPVRVRKTDLFWRLLFGGCWVAMAVIYFSRCRLHKRKLRLLIILNALAILIGTLMPEVWIESASTQLKNKIGRSIEKSSEANTNIKSENTSAKPAQQSLSNSPKIDQFNTVVDSGHYYGHIALFASLCFWVYCSAALERQPSSYYLRVAFDIFLFAGITEALQYLTLDRSAGVGDLLYDVYGMAIALAVFLMIRPVLMRKSAV